MYTLGFEHAAWTWNQAKSTIVFCSTYNSSEDFDFTHESIIGNMFVFRLMRAFESSGISVWLGNQDVDAVAGCNFAHRM